MEQITSVPLATCFYREDNRLNGQKVGTAGVVVDHSKDSGLELRQPHGAQAVGLVWRGESVRP